MQKNVQAIADQSLALTLLPFEHWAQWADFFVQQPKTWMTPRKKPTEPTNVKPTAQTEVMSPAEPHPVALDLGETVDDLTRISGVGQNWQKS